ncbi:MAG: HipA N-terminal domain-containing protein, partial [Candidatus Zixiibacteriota bacterium]
MVEVAEVKIWGDRVGAVSWNESRGYASFEYDRKFLERGYDLSPIKMPIQQAQSGRAIFEFPELNPDTYYGLPGMLSDSLPDRFGTLLLNRWLAEQGRELGEINPIERLCYTGSRGMGALEYWPPHAILESKSKTVEVDRLVRLASEVLSERNKLQANMTNLDNDGLMEIIRVGTSAGGARAKAVIAYNKTTGDIRSGQIDIITDYDYWIIKLDGVYTEQLGDPLGYGKIESAFDRIATDCGITMTECDLKWDGDRAHFMTKRFDRKDGGKIHMQTLCGLAHFDYNMPQAYGYEQA